MQSRQITLLPFYRPVWQFLFQWPADQPLLFLGGDSRYQLIGSRWEELSFAEFLENEIASRVDQFQTELPLQTGYLGIISYDDFSPFADKPCKSKIFRITEAYVFDQDQLKIWQCGEHHFGGTRNFSVPEIGVPRKLSPKFTLQPLSSDQQHLQNITSAIADIRAGRFYQINLIRMFELQGECHRHAFLRRLMHNCGPFSCYIDLPEFSVISFSPERFVKIIPTLYGGNIQTFPIKGTTGRSVNSREDEINKQQLLNSGKDLAELHMIVDLMRNDLNHICKPRSVDVISPHTLHSFSNVHHLIAEVHGTLQENCRFREFFNSLCPAGSITGAPKIEVMKAIKEYEVSDRGYFMGNVFYYDPFTGYFDSSVLIRSVVRNGIKKPYCYAAGSGITVASEPESELREVEVKCRVVSS